MGEANCVSIVAVFVCSTVKGAVTHAVTRRGLLVHDF